MEQGTQSRASVHISLCSPIHTHPLTQPSTHPLTHTQAALKVISHLLTESEIKKLRDVFRSLDTDNDGTITAQEFSTGLHQAGYSVLENEVLCMMP
jgi:hypothetical protein